MKIPFLIQTEDQNYVVFETSSNNALDVALAALHFSEEDYLSCEEFNTFEYGDTRDYEVLE